MTHFITLPYHNYCDQVVTNVIYWTTFVTFVADGLDGRTLMYVDDHRDKRKISKITTNSTQVVRQSTNYSIKDKYIENSQSKKFEIMNVLLILEHYIDLSNTHI